MSGIINPFANKPSSGPRIRILACGKCKTIEVLGPMYEGPRDRADELDTVLNVAVERHQDGIERIPHAPASLMDVAQEDWDNPDAQASIRAQIAASFDPNAETGLGAEAYAIRDNFRDDAMVCWEQHRRTPTCSDYKSESKQLVPDTKAERKAAGIMPFQRGNPDTQRFLCEYCPVHSLVMQAKRKKAGLYDQ
jgi:hypothetical protein